MPGYKIAYPMVSVDARRAGFNGVALGGRQVYGVVADAECVQGPRHRPPSSWCDCGFYCFHERDEARALACDPQYAHSVVLDVLCSGRYFRYERGLRYARQTVRGVRVGRCDCGRAGAAFAGAPTGVVGWRRLVPVCASCAGVRPVLTFATFGRLVGDPGSPLDVRTDEGVEDAAFTSLAGGTTGGTDEPRADDGLDDAARVSLLAAEVALLQARLDDVQSRLDRLTRRPD